jgi:hypothetical protein
MEKGEGREEEDVGALAQKSVFLTAANPLIALT